LRRVRANHKSKIDRTLGGTRPWDDDRMVEFRVATRADVPAILAMLEDDEITRSRMIDDAGRSRTAENDPAGHLDGNDDAGRGRLDVVAEQADAALWRAFEAIDADPRNDLIVADEDGAVIGTCQLTFTPSLSRGGAERMTIEAVRVRRDHRGTGVGRAMMVWALDRARERGCRLAQLTTDRRRTDAHRFYESLGFVPSHVGMKRSLP
jgi:GNAT superfamily N-acetyltransferase